ncbi:MAG: NADH-quinone oxidoreductase subunit N [Thermomicrobiales bacterium]|nr:NADH-quinone oxidoreductase subunit N [Thermomicrobiales bacterium]
MLVDLSRGLLTPEWSVLYPQLIVFGLAILLMLLDVFVPRRLHYGLLTAVSLIGYVVAAAALWTQDGKNVATFWWGFRADGLSVFLSLVVLIAAVLSVMTAASYVDQLEGHLPIGEFYVLLAFAVLGAMLVGASGDLVMIFVTIELSSLATYVLTAFAKRRLTALEGGMKYFLLGIFASAILVYGMAWVYGLTGSTNLDAIALALQNSVTGANGLDPSLVLALLLVIVGLGFKMAAVPFHFWTPDAYDGAATPVTAYMSVIPKVAAFAASIRLLVQALGPVADDWVNVIALLALITMVFGNIVAVSQRDVKRMLAYSSIAHTGYMMVGLAAYRSSSGFLSPGATPTTGDNGISSLLTYLLAYAVMNIGAFAVVAWVQHRGRGLMLEDYNGLAAQEPLAAAALTVFLISLMGIPPTIGFYAKYKVIVAAIEIGPVGLILAIAIVVLSAVSAFYYLRVVAVMYFNPPETELRPAQTGLLNVGIAAMAVVTLIGAVVFSGQAVALADRWYHALSVLAYAGFGG